MELRDHHQEDFLAAPEAAVEKYMLAMLQEEPEAAEDLELPQVLQVVEIQAAEAAVVK
jgi:hypothetical protein